MHVYITNVACVHLRVRVCVCVCEFPTSIWNQKKENSTPTHTPGCILMIKRVISYQNPLYNDYLKSKEIII